MVSGRTIASASDFGNNWQTQPRTILSTARNGTRLGLPRRSTMICCRNTRISASNAARGRNSSTTIPKIILQRSNIPQEIIRFCVSRQLDQIYDRDSPDVRFWPIADIASCTAHVCFWGIKRTWLLHRKMSTYDPKRTFGLIDILKPVVRQFVTRCRVAKC